MDLRIVETYYKQTLEADRTLATPEELLEASKRLMETLDVLSNKDGEDYAHGLMNIISSLASQSSSDTQMILQNVVEEVLLSLREGDLVSRVPLTNNLKVFMNSSSRLSRRLSRGFLCAH